MPVLVTHGNHDPLDGWSAIREWPAGVHVFSPDVVEQVPVERDGTVLATVHGISYARRDPGENLALRFAGPAGEGLQVGVLHCNVGADPAHAAYSPCSVDDLRRVGPRLLGPRARPPARDPGRGAAGGLPGLPAGPRSRARELGPKGALVVEVDGGAVGRRAARRARPGALRARRRRRRAAGRPGGAARAPGREAAARRVAAPGRGLVLRARLHGRGPVHGDLRAAAGVAELLGELRAEAVGADPFAFWESIDDATAPPLDREAILHRDDFQARCCGWSTRPTATRSWPPSWRGGDAARGARAAAAAPGSAMRRSTRQGLLDAAEARALDLLESEAVDVRITGWSIDGFGVFHDEERRDLGQGLTVLLGPNEAGKSTLLAFVRGVLFGFPDGRAAHGPALPAAERRGARGAAVPVRARRRVRARARRRAQGDPAAAPARRARGRRRPAARRCSAAPTGRSSARCSRSA